jgi:pyruvate formate lyase activating enzyme
MLAPRGYVNTLQCDPIEKKPFFHVRPGALAMSFGMLGCGLHCGYCKNWVTSQALRAGLLTGFVSNGNATPEVLKYLRPWLDLYKVDLKGFDDRKYRELGGRLGPILDSIQRVHEMGFWLEIVTLVAPGFNDSEAELKEMARFIPGVSEEIPGHVRAFHQD